MVDALLVTRRIVAQGLVGSRQHSATDVVRAFGASQGQDLPGVVSSVAMRLNLPPREAVTEVERAFATGEIVRGYPMRGTVFVTAAEDLRWMTQLCAPGEIRASAARREKHLGLAETEIHRARAVLEDVTAEGGIPRSALMQRWSELGIATERGHQYHIMKHLLMTDVAVYGPLSGRENLVVAGHRWLPPGSSLRERFGGDRIAAAAELLQRYITSRGPATLRDAAWFSKLPLGTLRSALPLIRDAVVEAGPDPRGEMRYERPGLAEDSRRHADHARFGMLLAPFDELVLGYPDRLAMMTPPAHENLVPGNNGIFQRGYVRRGEIVARWKRVGSAASPRLELQPLDERRKLPKIAVTEAHRSFAVFPWYPIVRATA